MASKLPYVSLYSWNPHIFINARSTENDYSTHKLLLGTHTSGTEQNYLMVADVRLPLEDTEIDARKYDDESQGSWYDWFISSIKTLD